MPYRRLKHVAPGMEKRDQSKCLPVVIVRDPYQWMQSMVCIYVILVVEEISDVQLQRPSNFFVWLSARVHIQLTGDTVTGGVQISPQMLKTMKNFMTWEWVIKARRLSA
jgi:hypothetical protein